MRLPPCFGKCKLSSHVKPATSPRRRPSAETFMFRLAVVLMVAGLGASGYAIVFPPPLGFAYPRWIRKFGGSMGSSRGTW